MSRRHRRGGEAGRRILLLLFWLVAVLGAFGAVIWRQARAVALEEHLRELESERAIAEAEQVELERRIQELGARARIIRIARQELGMHVPEPDEIIFLPAGGGGESSLQTSGERR